MIKERRKPRCGVREKGCRGRKIESDSIRQANCMGEEKVKEKLRMHVALSV